MIKCWCVVFALLFTMASSANAQTILGDRFVFNTGPRLITGVGSPDGAQTASVGSIYIQSDGSVWRKRSGSGNTGWVVEPATTTQAAHAVYAGPTTGTALPTFRALLDADLPFGAPGTVGQIIVSDADPKWTPLAVGSLGAFLRTGGSGQPTAWSMLVLPNAATSGDLVYAIGMNSWGESANLTFTGGDTLTAPKVVGSTSITDNGLSSGRVTFAGASGLLSDDTDLTFATDTLTATKVVGSTSITDNGLSSGRVTFAGTSGLLSDDSDLTFVTDTLTATKVVAPTSVTTPSIVTAAGPVNLSIAPTGDLITNPTGKDILPNANYDINIGSPTLKYLALDVAELHAQTLVAQDVIATIGGYVEIAPTTLLTADLASGGTTITVKNKIALDAVVIGHQIFMKSAPFGTSQFEAMSVDSVAGGSAGAWTYTVTRDLGGTGPNDWYSGDAVMDTGTIGDGYIDLYSITGLLGTGIGPTIVGNVHTGATYSAIAPRWAIGNLNGLYGYGATTYGAAFGDPSATNVTIDATPVTGGFKIRSGTTDKFTADTSGNLALVGDLNIGTSGDLRSGATAYSTGIGYWVDYNGGAPRFRVGDPSGNQIGWDGTNLSVNQGNVVIDSTGIRLAPVTSFAKPVAVANSYGFTLSSGNVGVGGFNTATPTRGLVLSSTYTAAGSVPSSIQLYTQGSSGTNNRGEMTLTASGASGGASLDVRAEKTTFTGAGIDAGTYDWARVGINTDPSGTPGAMVEIVGDTTSASSNAPSLLLSDSVSGGKKMLVHVEGTKAGLYENAGAFGDILTLDLANNRVGVGTASPAQMLDISSTAPSFQMTDTTAAAKSFQLKVDANKAEFYDPVNAAGTLMTLDLAASQLSTYNGISVNTNGTVTSGVVNFLAGANWDVLGYAGSSTLEFGGYRSSQWTELKFFTSGNEAFKIDTSGRWFTSLISAATTGHLVCWNTGTGEITHGTSCTVSSLRFKQNIVSLDERRGLMSVLSMRPVRFEYRPETHYGEGTFLGLIAEELAPIVPEVITFDQDKRISGIDYPMLVPVLVKAIQELEARVRTLEHK